MPIIISPYQQFMGSGGSSQEQQELSNQLNSLAERISTIEQALIDHGILNDTHNDEVQEMLDDVFSGKDTEPVIPQNEQEAEVFNMLDDVFSGIDTDIYEDEVTQDLDTIFNP